jgi:hypothetical protein
MNVNWLRNIPALFLLVLLSNNYLVTQQDKNWHLPGLMLSDEKKGVNDASYSTLSQRGRLDDGDDICVGDKESVIIAVLLHGYLAHKLQKLQNWRTDKLHIKTAISHLGHG